MERANTTGSYVDDDFQVCDNNTDAEVRAIFENFRVLPRERWVTYSSTVTPSNTSSFASVTRSAIVISPRTLSRIMSDGKNKSMRNSVENVSTCYNNADTHSIDISDDDDAIANATSDVHDRKVVDAYDVENNGTGDEVRRENKNVLAQHASSPNQFAENGQPDGNNGSLCEMIDNSFYPDQTESGDSDPLGYHPDTELPDAEIDDFARNAQQKWCTDHNNNDDEQMHAEHAIPMIGSAYQ